MLVLLLKGMEIKDNFYFIFFFVYYIGDGIPSKFASRVTFGNSNQYWISGNGN